MAFAATPDGVQALVSVREAWAEAQASVAGSLGPEMATTLDT